jgi:hypothetical protein
VTSLFAFFAACQVFRIEVIERLQTAASGRIGASIERQLRPVTNRFFRSLVTFHALPLVSNSRMSKSIAYLVLFLLAPIAQAVPRYLLNPDVVPATLSQTVCTPGYTKAVRPSTTFTNGIKRRLMREQGMDFNVDKGSFELDHIIPLALGGHPRNPRNLMLQAWDGHDGAKRKDRLEVKLQCLVCSGDVPLEVAQDAIWTDWQAAYGVYGRMVCHRRRALQSDDYGDN